MELLKQELYNLIRLGINQCIESGCQVLVSHVAGAGTLDPLISFRNAEKRGKGHIVYWADSDANFILAGVGSAYSIQVTNTGPGRFMEVEERWRDIAGKSIQSFHADIPGTGMVLLGGGAFDPVKPRSERWRQFASAEFHIPQMLLTYADGQSWITLNFWLNGNENPQETTDYLLHECAWFLNEENQHGSSVKRSYTMEEINSDQWIEMVGEAVAEIRTGELKKVVLARELRLYSDNPICASNILRRLHADQPGSYIFAFSHNGDCLLGASPERLIRRKGDYYYSTCLAGSIRRGESPMEDQILGEELLNDSKNLFEQGLVVRMIGEKLKKYCQTLEIPEVPFLLKLRNIQHLCTLLVGKAREGTSLFSVLADLHPTPALGGFPQQQAVKKIRDKEQLDRGWYGGPIGWIDAKGAGEFIVAIRCGLVRGKEVSLFAGCGIVGDSDPISEYEETRLKFQPMLSALGGD